MLNKIFLMGRLVVDPELKSTPSGTAVATFRIAVDRDRKDANGDKQTDFVQIVAWRNTAEFVSRYFTKGRMAVVEGRLQITNYTDRDGAKRSKAEVIADSVYFGDARPGGGNDSGYSAPAPSYGYGAPSAGGFSEMNDDDGELPF